MRCGLASGLLNCVFKHGFPAVLTENFAARLWVEPDGNIPDPDGLTGFPPGPVLGPKCTGLPLR